MATEPLLHGDIVQEIVQEVLQRDISWLGWADKFLDRCDAALQVGKREGCVVIQLEPEAPSQGLNGGA